MKTIFNPWIGMICAILTVGASALHDSTAANPLESKQLSLVKVLGTTPLNAQLQKVCMMLRQRSSRNST
jgi:hypothetical protein